MPTAKITSKDFLALMEDQNDQPTSLGLGSFGAGISSPPQKPAAVELENADKNRQQSGNKPTTNRKQSSNKPATNRQQTGNIEGLVKQSKKESGNKPSTQPATQVATKWQQTDNKPETKTHFSSLVGLQREIILLVYSQCKISRSKETNPLTLRFIASVVKTTENSAKVTIQRLEKKNLINRVESKNGRGGWARFELSESVYGELLQLETGNKVETNWQQTDNKPSTQPATEPATSSPSSSSSFLDLKNLKTTTTDEVECLDQVKLSPDWEDVDFSPIADIGFSRVHLIQLAKHGKLSALEVQDSIHFFAFDLKRNSKAKEIKTSPLNFFMGLLRKGELYAPPQNYESPSDEARRKRREFLERKEHDRKAEEQKLLDLEFSEWRRGLSQADIEKMVPEFARRPGPFQDSALMTHFETHVWPEISLKMSVEISNAEREKIRTAISESLGEERG
jgi:hypothetical protein